MSSENINVKSTDLDDETKTHIVDILSSLYNEHKTQPSQLATAIKTKLDEEMGSPWHVIVGKSFCSSISHEPKGFIYLYIENYAILCFKTA